MSHLLRVNIETILGTGIDEKSFAAFVSLMHEKNFEKKSFLCEEGTLCRRIFFVMRGSCYSFLTEADGEKQVVQFAVEGNWISDLFSFFQDREAIYSIEALESLTVLALDRLEFQTACDTIPWVDRFFRLRSKRIIPL